MCVFKLTKVHLLVRELYIYQNVRCNDKKYVLVNLQGSFDYCNNGSRTHEHH